MRYLAYFIFHFSKVYGSISTSDSWAQREEGKCPGSPATESPSSLRSCGVLSRYVTLHSLGKLCINSWARGFRRNSHSRDQSQEFIRAWSPPLIPPDTVRRFQNQQGWLTFPYGLEFQAGTLTSLTFSHGCSLSGQGREMLHSREVGQARCVVRGKGRKAVEKAEAPSEGTQARHSDTARTHAHSPESSVFLFTHRVSRVTWNLVLQLEMLKN